MPMLDSGIGSFEDAAEKTHSHVDMFDMSTNLVESLAEELCDENERKAMVARMAKMTITTISSTKVNARFLSFNIG
jgi:hypothetical protein